VQGVFEGIPIPLIFSITSVVPVPDGTETQYMCPREFPLFPVFQRFPQYLFFMYTVSEIVFTVSETRRPVSIIYVTYPGVGSLRGVPNPQGYHSCQLSRSCEFECRARGLPGRESSGGSPPCL
jgi:hypothetical protein